MLTPIYPEKNALVLAADDNYSANLAVTINSIIANGDSHTGCDIIILSSNISAEMQNRLLSLQRDNISIRFFAMEKS